MDPQEYVEIMEVGDVYLGRQNFIQQRPKLQYLNIHWEGDLVSALLRSLKLAQKEYRIRVGFSSAMKILELDPASVVMCILPVNDKKDPLSHLQLMLIEAYCTENGIRLLKVVSSDELSYLVKPLPETDDEAEDLDDDEFADDDCTSLIVIQNSHHDHVEDYELQKTYDFASLRCNARPIIHLPS